jgi:hypothetical protein
MVVRIVWEDVEDESSWFSAKTLSEFSKRRILVTQVGFVALRTRSHIILCSQETNDGDWGSCTRIPRSLIRSITRVR